MEQDKEQGVTDTTSDTAANTTPTRRKPGRPKGSKNKPKLKPPTIRIPKQTPPTREGATQTGGGVAGEAGSPQNTERTETTAKMAKAVEVVGEAGEVKGPPNREFRLTSSQVEALKVCAGGATHIMLEGGSGAAKTFLHVRNIIVRALKSPGSRHGIFRFRGAHVVASVGRETLPDVLRLAFPDLEVKVDRAEWIWRFPNGSEIYLAGLDDKERVEKILGRGLVTALLNECSQISWEARNFVVTRLRQKVWDNVAGAELKTRVFYDQNPPSKSHWTYKVFHLGRDPETGEALPRWADEYAWLNMHPKGNVENLAEGYLNALQDMPARFRRRFWDGEYSDDSDGVLFRPETIETWRAIDGALPDMVRVVIGVDPSGADDGHPDADEIGITVGGLGVDGNAYLLEDLTIHGGPKKWGDIVASAFDRRSADLVVGERNYGGAMVGHVIRTARPGTPFKEVVASRGKHVRAEPFSSLYERGKIRHAGRFQKLEDELCGFTTRGYNGSGSPNRADSWFWVLSELFPSTMVYRPESSRPVRDLMARSFAEDGGRRTTIARGFW